jgi:hypothetical protein
LLERIILKMVIFQGGKSKNTTEVMVEKETLRPLFKQILFDREVRIVPNHGWSSMPDRHPVFNRLRLKHRDIRYMSCMQVTLIRPARGWLGISL